MKIHFIIVLFVALSFSLAAQHPNLDTIKAYYNSASSSELAEQIYYKNIKFYIEWAVEGIGDLSPEHYSFEAKMLAKTILELEAQMQKVRKSECIIFLEPKFKDAKNFNFDRNIYDFLTFDAHCTAAVCFNDQIGEIIFLSGRNISIHSEALPKEDAEEMKRFIKEENPDALLSEGMIFREGTVYSNELGHKFEVIESNVNYLFLKGDKIFVYRTIDGEKYELNEFVRKFFEEEKMIQRAILSEKGLL